MLYRKITLSAMHIRLCLAFVQGRATPGWIRCWGCRGLDIDTIMLACNEAPGPGEFVIYNSNNQYFAFDPQHPVDRLFGAAGCGPFTGVLVGQFIYLHMVE